MAAKKKCAKASIPIDFVESMECLPVMALPDGKDWSYEIKLDGFRLEAVKRHGETTLFSRRGNILSRKFPYIAAALSELPDDTILDGEIVALDDQGDRTSISYKTSAPPNQRFIITCSTS